MPICSETRRVAASCRIVKLNSFAQKSIKTESMSFRQNSWFFFVAARRPRLARSFKAGTSVPQGNLVAVATLESWRVYGLLKTKTSATGAVLGTSGNSVAIKEAGTEKLRSSALIK